MNNIKREEYENRVSTAITTIKLAILESKKSIEELSKEEFSSTERIAYAYFLGMESLLNDMEDVWRNAE